MINTPNKQLQKGDTQLHPALLLLIFICLLIGLLLVCTLLGQGLVYLLYGKDTATALETLNPAAPHMVQALWIVQVVGTTLPLLIAPLFFAYVIVNNVRDYIKPSFKFRWVLLVLILAIMFVSNPMIEFLSNLNEKMVLPHWLQWMKDAENSAEKLMETMLQMKTIGDLVLNIVLVALLTAIVEEFTFRGVIKTIFIRWTKNTHVAIWITAIIFSAIHMEFFGFLPRLALGVFFGYFVAWSGSIWTSVWAHFINNGTDVAVTYLFQHKLINIDPNNQHLYSRLTYVLSTLLILGLLIVYRMIAKYKTDNQQD